MADIVKRQYRSDLRAGQARETQRRIVAAAADLFVSAGYGPTSVDEIAAAAGVSRKTVFTAIGGKTELLAAALNQAIAGDDEPVALADRPELVAVLKGEDPGELLDGWAAVLAGIDARVADLYAALESAAALDASAKDLFDRLYAQRREGARAVVAALEDLGGLRDRLTRSDAVDLACLFSEPLVYRRLVGVNGWSGRRFGRWLAATLREQLLGA